MIGGGVGDGVPAEDEDLCVAAGFGDPRHAFPATGFVGDREARTRRGAVVGVPTLAGGGLLYLDAKRPADLLQVASLPIVGAQRPLGLELLRHHLLDILATD